MPRILVFLVTTSLLAAPKPSSLRFDSTVFDFGATNPPPVLTGTFTFQNVGSSAVTLRRPVTSCGCAVADVKPERLQPGERGELVFNIHLSGSSRGLIQKQIYVQADSPGETGVTLTVTAHLVPLYEMEPPQLNFGDLRRGMVSNATVRVRRTDGKPLDVGVAVPSHPQISARLEPVPQSNHTALVHVALQAEGEPRWLYERVGFRTALATQEVAVLPIYARIVGDIVLNREEIYWAIANRAAPGTRSFRVKPSDPARTLEIKNLVCTLPEVVLKSEPLPGGGYEIAIELRRVPSQTARGTISFETNMPSQPKVTVPITLQVLKF